MPGKRGRPPKRRMASARPSIAVAPSSSSHQGSGSRKSAPANFNPLDTEMTDGDFANESITVGGAEDNTVESSPIEPETQENGIEIPEVQLAVRFQPEAQLEPEIQSQPKVQSQPQQLEQEEFIKCQDRDPAETESLQSIDAISVRGGDVDDFSSVEVHPQFGGGHVGEIDATGFPAAIPAPAIGASNLPPKVKMNTIISGRAGLLSTGRPNFADDNGPANGNVPAASLNGYRPQSNHSIGDNQVHSFNANANHHHTSHIIDTPLASQSAPVAPVSYETATNLDQIIIRQMKEDIAAYKYDLDYCKSRLDDMDLTPQETRTMQLRTLDLAHQIRHCTHRVEVLEFQMRGSGSGYGTSGNRGGPVMQSVYQASASAGNGHAGRSAPGGGNANGFDNRRTSSGAGYTMKRTGGSSFTPIAKRGATEGPESSSTPASKRAKTVAPVPSYNASSTIGVAAGSSRARGPSSLGGDDPDDQSDDDETGSQPPGGAVAQDGRYLELKRLGFWQCHLCEAPKYLLAGAGRVPAMPCKWPLKDVSKMITHFTDMHMEHTPQEKCMELGKALWTNVGPLEYWLRRTRGQKLGDGAMIHEIIDSLQAGKMPDALRRLSRAAAGMPTTDE